MKTKKKTTKKPPTKKPKTPKKPQAAKKRGGKAKSPIYAAAKAYLATHKSASFAEARSALKKQGVKGTLIPIVYGRAKLANGTATGATSRKRQEATRKASSKRVGVSASGDSAKAAAEEICSAIMKLADRASTAEASLRRVVDMARDIG